jgi:hypothetical protein
VVARENKQETEVLGSLIQERMYSEFGRVGQRRWYVNIGGIANERPAMAMDLYHTTHESAATGDSLMVEKNTRKDGRPVPDYRL